jgi:hypothetical protein
LSRRDRAGKLDRMAGITKAALVAALAATALAAPAGAHAASYTTAEDCREHESFVHGDEAAVQARLPERYEPVRESGKPLVFARAVRCAAFTVDGRSAPATLAMYGIVVETDDGRGCASGLRPVSDVKGDFPPACNLYALRWQVDDARLARWLPFPGAEHARGLEFVVEQHDPAKNGAPFRFRAPDWSIDAVGRERPGAISIRRAYKQATAGGIATMHFSSDTLVAGDATGTVSAPAGSDLATLMGATERGYAGPYGSFAAERFDAGVFRRQLADGSGLSGECALKGDVTFDPRASYYDQVLNYTYDATGTCGETPVTLHLAGRAFGGCHAAHTTAPGEGTLTLATGERVDYTLDFTTEGTEVHATFYGERAGTAAVSTSFRTDRTPRDVAARCAGGGVTSTPMDGTLRTESPLAGDRRPRGSQGATPPQAPPAGGAPRPLDERPALRIAVRPTRVRAGRRRAFVFVVTTTEGRPVAGARVTLAGRAARTNARGVARLVARLRPGRRTVRVAVPGTRPARATVVARR